MKETRIFALILALVMALAMFGGCGGGGDEVSSEVSSYEVILPSEYSKPTVKKAEKWTAEHGDVAGWVFSSLAENIFYASEENDPDSVAFLQFVEKLTDGRTLDDVMQEYIDDINTNGYYNSQDWIIETPKMITFGGKESYEISVNYSIQIRAARHYHIIFTQLDDEVFVYNNNYTIRQEASDETAINNLIDSVKFVPMA